MKFHQEEAVYARAKSLEKHSFLWSLSEKPSTYFLPAPGAAGGACKQRNFPGWAQSQSRRFGHRLSLNQTKGVERFRAVQEAQIANSQARRSGIIAIDPNAATTIPIRVRLRAGAKFPPPGLVPSGRPRGRVQIDNDAETTGSNDGGPRLPARGPRDPARSCSRVPGPP